MCRQHLHAKNYVQVLALLHFYYVLYFYVATCVNYHVMCIVFLFDAVGTATGTALELLISFVPET